MFQAMKRPLGVLIGVFIWVFLMLGFVYLALMPLDKDKDNRLDRPPVSPEFWEKLGREPPDENSSTGPKYWNERHKPRGETP